MRTETKNKFPYLLFIVYLIYFVVLAVKPYDRAVWVAENIPVVIIVGFLAFTYRKYRFSNASYIMMGIFIFLHTLGGHYTFERVPFDFVTDIFGFERNHYDRVAHFSVGFYAYPIAEYLDRKKIIQSKLVLAIFGIFTIFTVAAVYEIIEWQYAVWSDPVSGAAFLGSQGDIWDAQKDMLADGLGSILAVFLYIISGRKWLKCNESGLKR